MLDIRTKLGEFGLSIDAIRDGENVEFEEVKPKAFREDRQLVDRQDVDPFVEACLSDLRAAYNMIERLQSDLDDSEAMIADLEATSSQLRIDIGRADGFEMKMTQVEAMMDALENSVNDYNIQHQKDLEQISSLQKQLVEGSERIDKLRSDFETAMTRADVLDREVVDLRADNRDLEAEKADLAKEFELLEEDVNYVLSVLRESLVSRGVPLDI